MNSQKLIQSTSLSSCLGNTKTDLEGGAHGAHQATAATSFHHGTQSAAGACAHSSGYANVAAPSTPNISGRGTSQSRGRLCRSCVDELQPGRTSFALGLDAQVARLCRASKTCSSTMLKLCAAHH